MDSFVTHNSPKVPYFSKKLSSSDIRDSKPIDCSCWLAASREVQTRWVDATAKQLIKELRLQLTEERNQNVAALEPIW